MKNEVIKANEYYGEIIDGLFDDYIRDVHSRILPTDDLKTVEMVVDVAQSFWLPLFDAVCALAYVCNVVVFNPLRGITNEEMFNKIVR